MIQRFSRVVQRLLLAAGLAVLVAGCGVLPEVMAPIGGLWEAPSAELGRPLATLAAPQGAPSRTTEAMPLPTMPASSISGPFIGSGGDWWEVYFSSGSKELGPESRVIAERLVELINAARVSIHIAAFETDIDEIADALIAAHERGVDVRWVTDDENGIDADVEEGHGQFARMEAAGIPIRDDQRSAFMHNKFIIFDNAILWTGSTNITWNDIGRNNNNVIVVDVPEVAAMYEREFAEMWDGKFGPKSPSTRESQNTVLQGTPFIVRFAPEDDPFEQLVALTARAQKSIYFMAFSYTHDDLGQVMRERAAAGVHVQGIFEVRGSETEYAELPPLYCAGLPMRQDGNPGTFHHKVVIIDETVVITGSMNFSSNAADSNDENVIAISNPDIARLFLDEFERRWAEGKDPDPADMECG